METKERIQAAIRENPNQMTMLLARQFGVPEVEVVRAFPDDRAVERDGGRGVIQIVAELSDPVARIAQRAGARNRIGPARHYAGAVDIRDAVRPARAHLEIRVVESQRAVVGEVARRFERSITATPVNSMFAPLGNPATLIVARAGVLPNSNCVA